MYGAEETSRQHSRPFQPASKQQAQMEHYQSELHRLDTKYAFSYIDTLSLYEKTGEGIKEEDGDSETGHGCKAIRRLACLTD